MPIWEQEDAGGEAEQLAPVCSSKLSRRAARGLRDTVHGDMAER